MRTSPITSPTAEASADLPITSEVSDTISHSVGPLGVVVRTAIACGQGALSTVGSFPPDSPVAWTNDNVASTYVDAVRWAEHLRGGNARSSAESACATKPVHLAHSPKIFGEFRNNRGGPSMGKSATKRGVRVLTD